MLQITIPASEKWDETNSIFLYSKEQVLQLEHSLVSLSKWESTWCKPFLSSPNLRRSETIDYIRCMTLTQNVDPTVYSSISSSLIKEVNEYIDLPMTATTFSKTNNVPSREIVTSEIIYYWMITLNIPFECQKWHLNRLLTLINVCNIKSQSPKKMSKNEIAKRNRAINAARRQSLNTKG